MEFLRFVGREKERKKKLRKEGASSQFRKQANISSPPPPFSSSSRERQFLRLLFRFFIAISFRFSTRTFEPRAFLLARKWPSTPSPTCAQ